MDTLAIDMENICVKAGLHYLLKDISWQVKPGEHWVVFGRNGCGKTTLLRDLIRQISDGASGRQGLTVGVVDERSEIGGCRL